MPPAAHERRIAVAVCPGAALAARSRLFAALEDAFPVSFVAGAAPPAAAPSTKEGVAAAIAISEGEHLPTAESLPSAIPVVAFGGTPRRGAEPGGVRFVDAAPVDRALQGLAVTDPLDGPDLDPFQPGQRVLAAAGLRAFWTRSTGPFAVDQVGSALPELGPEQSLRDLLFARPLATVALVELLRAATGTGALRPPPRASFIFDDPNLRRPRYGFIDYRRLLLHAEEHGYHAAMAMIPLDGRHQHRATVDLFRRNPGRLSLTMHGNDHRSRELLRPSSAAEAVPIAAQALRRAARFEATYQLRMDRVMTPPHGMCSAASAGALGRLGYDALCAIHPLPWRESAPPECPVAGWEPADFAAGCAVIPRLPLGLTGTTELALRAFLGQPLILYGHHVDLAGGLGPLATAAADINRLGDVHWSSLGEIAATNFVGPLEGGTLRVRPYSGRLRIEVPAGAGALAVECPRDADERLAGWSVAGGAPQPFGAAVECAPGSAEVRLHPADPLDLEAAPYPRPRVWPLVRRTATETRDRLAPILMAGS
jgi:hypothetical protein